MTISLARRKEVEQVLSNLWTDWTPIYGATGSMTFSSVTTSFARYCQIGSIVFFEMRAVGTTGGTASTGITIELPINATDNVAFSAVVIPSGSTQQAGAAWLSGSGNVITVRLYDASNWPLGAGTTVYVSGHYEPTVTI